jgi:transcriptional/translational regulatory protein YebC/TACO1
MSGHSKWSTIKRKKGATDAKRGKIFTRLARDIVMAAKEGGGDEDSNPKLKLAIAKAKAENMPKDNIDRAIARGSGKGDGAEMEEMTFEGYGLDGAGGAMATAGSVSWQFEQKGYIELEGDGLDFDEVFMVAAEAGADDVSNEEGTIAVYTPRELFGAVEQALVDGGYKVAESELRWEAKNETEVSAEKAAQNLKLMNDLEELDDVQTVASNLLITDEALAAFETA